jgi:hypothetical protein
LGELQGIPPTGKRVEAPGSVFYRIIGGKIVEFRGQLDMMRIMQQLGSYTVSAARRSLSYSANSDRQTFVVVCS